MNPRATLANDNIARNDCFATENLHAKPFGFGVASVLTAAACFFMSHCAVPVLPRLHFIQAVQILIRSEPIFSSSF
jgi:hypothetical protein